MRELGDVDEAMRVLEDLQRTDPERGALYRVQSGITLCLGWRYREALAFVESLGERERERIDYRVRGDAGDLRGRVEHLDRRIDESVSRRFQIELSGARLNAAHSLDGVSFGEALSLLERARIVGHRGSMAMALRVIGERNLFHDKAFRRCVSEIHELSESRGKPFVSEAIVWAMHAYATGAETSVEAVVQVANSVPFRSSEWVRVHMLLTLLGIEFEGSCEPQWPVSEAVVIDRWRQNFDRIVDRARHLTQPDL